MSPHLPVSLPPELSTAFSQVDAFVMDMDGVLTDGFTYAFETGEGVRRFQIKDGYALQHAVKSGYRVAIISGGTSEGARKRFESLGITELHFGVAHKLQTFHELLLRWQLTPERVLYIGDDVPDYEVMQAAGVRCAPADAAVDILAIAQYVCQARGGFGCVREVIELALRLQGRWHSDHSTKW